jgi:xylan 1,4-beta-xylosidase
LKYIKFNRVITIVVSALIFSGLSISCWPKHPLTPETPPGQKTVLVVDASMKTGVYEHSISRIVGSGHLGLYDREGWHERLTSQITRAHQEAGFEYLRGHAVLSDDVGIYQGPGQYDFTKLDRIYDRILAAGMRPFVELSYMPRKLKSGPQRGFPTGYAPYISPPNDYKEWEGLVFAFVKHCVDRYGIEEVRKWYFEI